MKQFCTKSFKNILDIAILHHCAKNQKKLMSQSQEKLVTDRRTDGRTYERTNDLELISASKMLLQWEILKTVLVKIAFFELFLGW